MATVEKNFRIKQGLTVEGASGTINGSNILTEASTEFLQDTVGAMVSTNNEGGIAVSYDDTNGKLDFNVDDFTITLGGDLSGSVTITNLASGTLTATVGANSVALGTDTTGDYVAGISAGTGISVSGSGGEGSTVTITNGGVTQLTGTANEVEVSAGTGSVTIGLPDNVTIGNNLTVTGNLTVNGTTTTINTDTLAVEDNIVLLNKNVTGTPTTDSGIEVERGDYTNAKIYWNETANAWYLSTPGDSAGAATDAAITTGGSINMFGTISDGATTATPDSSNDTLTFTGSGAITVNVNSTSDTVTIGTNATAKLQVGSVELVNGLVDSRTTTSAGTTVMIDLFDIELYRTAKYLIQAYKSGDVEVTELLVTYDSSYNIYITEYGNMFSNVSLAEYSATFIAGEASYVNVTATTTAGTTFKLIKTYIEV